MQCSLEQRMAIKFCVKLEKSAAETIPMLKKAFGVDCLSDRQIFQGLLQKVGKMSKMSTTRTALDGHQPPVPTTIRPGPHPAGRATATWNTGYRYAAAWKTVVAPAPAALAGPRTPGIRDIDTRPPGRRSRVLKMSDMKILSNGMLSGFVSDLDTAQRILLQNFSTPMETVFFQEPRYFGGLRLFQKEESRLEMNHAAEGLHLQES
ncbi:hypothetical protein NQ318_022037 [Aromia moschata]|uniref:Uncharacterized protein n=1 Tax=Aromia moschata TaxID=1265417 RepID=A0AAV8Z5K4_9CUCU|nr:hypothetical protein NQ318_022037 [Aromia moschata]